VLVIGNADADAAEALATASAKHTIIDLTRGLIAKSQAQRDVEKISP
jgi:hypothetical protein